MKLLCAQVLLTVAVAALLTGCATSTEGTLPELSVQALNCHSGEVKSYRRGYARARILVLLPADSSGRVASHDDQVSDPSFTVPKDAIEVGVIADRAGATMQRIYSPPLAPTVQSALAEAAKEAGLVPTTSGDALAVALRRTDEDYVLASTITACWVIKASASDPASGTMWVSKATFALGVEDL